MENVNYLSCTGNVIDGNIGFGASVLVAPENNPNANRITGRCDEKGTLKFSQLSICSIMTLLTLEQFELENPKECRESQNPTQEQTQEVSSGSFWNNEFSQCNCSYANSTEAIIGIGRRGQGGGAGVDTLTARYTLDLLIEPEWDYLSFEYDFLTAPAPADLEVSIIDGENTYPVFQTNSETVFNETHLETGLRDISFLHGKSVILQIDLVSTLPDALVSIKNITFWKDPYNGNIPPTAHAGEDQRKKVFCNELAEITLDGSQSFDPNQDDELHYSWFSDGGLLASGTTPTVQLPAGAYLITLVVRDSAENTSSDEVEITIDSEPCPFIRGDSNTDGTIDISDAINTLDWLFLGNSSIFCKDSADTNDSGEIDISDSIFTLEFLFLGIRIIPQPHPDRGLDITEDSLNCLRYE